MDGAKIQEYRTTNEHFAARAFSCVLCACLMVAFHPSPLTSQTTGENRQTFFLPFIGNEPPIKLLQSYRVNAFGADYHKILVQNMLSESIASFEVSFTVTEIYSQQQISSTVRIDADPMLLPGQQAWYSFGYGAARALLDGPIQISSISFFTRTDLVPITINVITHTTYAEHYPWSVAPVWYLLVTTMTLSSDVDVHNVQLRAHAAGCNWYTLQDSAVPNLTARKPVQYVWRVSNVPYIKNSCSGGADDELRFLFGFGHR